MRLWIKQKDRGPLISGSRMCHPMTRTLHANQEDLVLGDIEIRVLDVSYPSEVYEG